MRQLPPPPADTVEVRLGIDVNGYGASTGFWLSIPGANSAGEPYLRGVLEDFFLEVGPALLDCMHAGASFSLFRATAYGAAPARALFYPAFTRGRWTGGQAENVAVGLYVTSSSAGRGSGSRLRLPAVPDVFVDDNARLSGAGFAQLLHAAVTLASWPPTVAAPGGGVAVLGTVERRRTAGPLSVATFAPAAGVAVSPRVETIRRRLPKAGRISPSP